MNDLYTVIIGALVVAVYAIYMTCYPEPQDGVLMSAIVGALMVLAGKRWGEKTALDEQVKVRFSHQPNGDGDEDD